MAESDQPIALVLLVYGIGDEADDIAVGRNEHFKDRIAVLARIADARRRRCGVRLGMDVGWGLGRGAARDRFGHAFFHGARSCCHDADSKIGA